MCLAIYRPPGVGIPEENLESGWNQNPDGGGFAYANKGRISVKKGYFKRKDMLADLKEAMEKHPNAPFLIHFRIRSMGHKDADNTHPYTYKHGVMIHNGTLSGTGALGLSGKSDSALFLDKFGDTFTYDFLNKHKDGLGESIDYNKLVFLFKDGKHVIINEKKGSWIDGVWYSNSYSLPYNRRTSSSTTGDSCDLAGAYGCSL